MFGSALVFAFVFIVGLVPLLLMNDSRAFPGAQITVVVGRRARRFSSARVAFQFVGFHVLLGSAEREFFRWVFGS